MGTSTTAQGETAQNVRKLSSVDEEKVSNIVEVCNVSRDEAVRVLDACHMDETVAIERFLSGAEVSTWSQVSKKKKQPVQVRSSSGMRGGYGQGRSQDRDRERDRDRDNDKDRDRDRDRSRKERDRNATDHSAYHSGHRRGARQSGISQRSRDLSSAKAKKQNLSNDSNLTHIPSATPSSDQAETWGKVSPEDPGGDLVSGNSARDGTWGLAPIASAKTWNDKTQSPPLCETGNGAWSAPPQSMASSSNAWSLQNSTEKLENGSEVKLDERVQTSQLPLARENLRKQTAVSAQAVKRNFNYAAAAAAGTTHEKAKNLGGDLSGNGPLNPVNGTKAVSSEGFDTEAFIPDTLAETSTDEVNESRTRHSRAARKQRPRREAEAKVLDVKEEATMSPGGKRKDYDSGSNNMAQTAAQRAIRSTTSTPWSSSRSAVDLENTSVTRHDSKPTTIAVAPAAATGSDPVTTDSLSLQFGSFGLGGLDGVNWSATEQTASDPGRNAIASPDAASKSSATAVKGPVRNATTSGSTSIPKETSAITIPPTEQPVARNAQMTNSARPQDMRNQPAVSSSIPVPPSSNATGSGVFPMLPVGPGGTFGPASYGAPYLMPQLHGYSPAMTSYENGGDMGSSRAPSLIPPGSMPMYDPGSIPGMASASAKYGGIPGLGEISTMQSGLPNSSKEVHRGGSSDIEKSNPGATTGLPAGMDPLAPPYMMPGGYPSMQYPMYTFPTGPYAPPPGMAHHGANPFPYAPTGQVSSQGTRGAFGFEDGSVSLNPTSRTGSGLGGESMYTPGYLNASISHPSSQKTTSEGSLKSMRVNTGSGLGAVGMGGMVPGMTYGEYPGSGIPAGNSGLGTAGNAPGGWNNTRHHSAGRGESGNGTGVLGNQPLASASPSSSMYAAGPGAPGGYWGPQQGGYYP